MVDEDDDNDKVVARLDATVLNPCQGIDEKGWACKNEARQGQSFCEQHLSLSLLASYTSKKSQGGTRRVKTRGGAGKKAAGTAAASSNPYEFYYYSGFGPSWGKRRGDRNGEGSKNNVVGTENSTMAEPGGGGDDNAGGGEVGGGSVSEMENEGIIDYVEDDDDEEEVVVMEDDSGKKRTRKPVKARSLKSLM